MNAGASTAAQAAIAAALRDQGELAGMPIQHQRRSVGSRKPAESLSMSIRPSMSSYFNEGATPTTGHDNNALEDNSNDEDAELLSKNQKNRNRRASEGSYLSKGESKKSAADLRCDTCGKGYKHSSCLTKHLYVALRVLMFTLLTLTLPDGNMILPGPSRQNYLFQNISKSSYSKLRPYCVT